MKKKVKKKTIERIRWWFYHPLFETIYLLGGIPKQHINTINYRNVESVFEDLKIKLNEKTNGKVIEK